MTTSVDIAAERAERVAAFLHPTSVAIVGATPSPARIGGRVVEYLATHRFEGRVYPVNPRHGEIQGLPAVPALADVPETVDLAVIAVPGEQVASVVQAAAGKARAYLVLSGGFGETGAAGAAAEEELIAAVRAQDALLLGPNAAGFVNLTARVAATFVPTYLPPTTAEDLAGPGRRVALVTQSGAFGAYLAGVARQRGLLPLNWVATGNEADLCTADFLAHYARQPGIDVIVAYLEGIGDPSRLAAALEAIDKSGKLLILSRTGTSEAGASAARSHTGALVGAGEGLEALLRGHRAVQTTSMDEVIDLALCATTGCVPGGRRLAIITGSGGAGVVMADAAVHAGFDLPPIPAQAAAAVLGNVSFAAAANPLDTTGQLMNDPTLLAQTLEPLVAGGDFDAVAAYVGGGTGDKHMVDVLVETVGAVRMRTPVPIALVGASTPDVLRQLHQSRVPLLYDPVRAVRMLAALADMSAEIADCAGGRNVGAPDAGQLHGLSLPRHWDEIGIKTVLRDLGFDVPRGKPAADAASAAAIADRIGYPVVIKGSATGLAHKSDIGAVRLDLRDAAATASAAESVLGELAGRGYADAGVLVEQQVPSGVELLVSVRRDPVYGVLFVLGSGGVWTELVHDVVAEILPTTTARLRHVLRGLRCWPQLSGSRGSVAVDVEALVTGLARIAEIGAALLRAGDLAELEFNPVIVDVGRARAEDVGRLWVADAVAYPGATGVPS